MITVKAAGDWELDVLGVPFGSPSQRDSDGEYFSARTNFHEDKFPAVPVVYFHGFDANKKPSGQPQYIGRTTSREVRTDGVWYRVVLDKTHELAQKVWDAAKKGMARASSGSIAHLWRKDPDGHIREWPVVELSIFDTYDGKQPANTYAVAIPVAKAVYKAANMALPVDIENLSETEGAALPGRGDGSNVTDGDDSDNDFLGEFEMDEKEVQALVAESVKAALDAREAQEKAERERQAEIDKAKADAVAAVKAEYEKKLAEGRRLPGGSDDAPYVAKFANLWKYDDLEPVDQAMMIGILGEAHRSGRSRGGYSEDAVKALMVKVADSKEDHYGSARNALKAAGFDSDGNAATKANELNQSTLASYGDEWIGVTYSTELWRKIAQDTPVVGNIPTIVVPQGSESITIPLESTAPTFYKVAQASAQAANPGAITRTVTTSKMGTGNASLTVGKLGAATYFTGELEEDSVIPWMAELRRSIEQEGVEVLEHVVIDGDTATGATTNINDIGGTPGGSEAFLLFNGFRKLGLVTNTANSRDGGALAASDFLETIKLMGIAGKNALQKDQVAFILDLWTHWKALELSEVKTRDVFMSPTIENGMLSSVWGYRVLPTANMHRANTDTTYGLKANTAGKVDLDTASNNTTGSILAVRWDQWRLGYKRRITFETTRVPSADSTEIVALMRVGMINRDTDASAISYNITV